MRQNLRDVKDECSKCANFFECELCLQGHGVKQQRNHIADMFKCQMEHRERMKKKYGEDYE